ncbi:recombinase family protein [Spirosoma fluminis]
MLNMFKVSCFWEVFERKWDISAVSYKIRHLPVLIDSIAFTSQSSKSRAFLNPLFGYSRVSTLEQNLDTQLNALQKAGCDEIFQDKITGIRAC